VWALRNEGQRKSVLKPFSGHLGKKFRIERNVLGAYQVVVRKKGVPNRLSGGTIAIFGEPDFGIFLLRKKLG